MVRRCTLRGGKLVMAYENGGSSYQRQLEQQIARYEVGAEIHKLPPIFDYWIHKHILPQAKEVTGAADQVSFYALWIEEAIRRTDIKRVVSLGAGDASVEVRIAQKLAAA